MAALGTENRRLWEENEQLWEDNGRLWEENQQAVFMQARMTKVEAEHKLMRTYVLHTATCETPDCVRCASLLIGIAQSDAI